MSFIFGARSKWAKIVREAEAGASSASQRTDPRPKALIYGKFLARGVELTIDEKGRVISERLVP